MPPLQSTKQQTLTDLPALPTHATPHHTPFSLPAAEKQLEKMKAEGLVEKPFVPKKRSFTFPPVEKMGARVVSIEGLTHGYNGRMLFKDADLEIEKGDRIAIIGPNG
jgi:ATPase subunit of ABC transporter with duplicated ATPase domains